MAFVRYENVNKIKQLAYSYWRSTVIRMNYSPSDYRNHCINWNFQTFYRTIWRLFNAWSVIVVMIVTLFSLINEDFLFNLNDLQRVTNINRIDLLAYESIILCLINENLWFCLCKRVLNYRSSFDNVLSGLQTYSERRLSKKYRQLLCNYFTIWNTIFMSLSDFLTLIIIIAIPMSTYLSFKLYQNGQINMIKFILFIIIYLLGSSHTNFLVQLLLTIGNFLLFFTKFLELRFLQLVRLMEFVIRQKRILRLKMFIQWHHFQIGYVRCFDELSKFNQTAKTLFFFGEIINKTATIFVCLFYSKQIDMNLFSSSCVLVAIIIFVLMNYVYYRLAKLPSYNRYCYRLILSWFVRIQTFDDRSIKRLGLYRQHRSRFWLKTNFFLQTIMTNHFGFTCGNLFIIDKFKIFELLLVNLPWIMLFYKKICLA